MDSNRSRFGILVGLAAAAGAFGVAAMMSVATAPTARADDFTDVINAVEGDYAVGQADFSTAFMDLSSNELTAGVASLFAGIDTDTLSPPDTLLAVTVEALTNEGVNPPDIAWGFFPPSSFTQGLDFAEADFPIAQGDFSDVATALSSGDYGDAVLSDLLGSDFSTLIPIQELLLGAVASL
jgi:hypothetical protein